MKHSVAVAFTFTGFALAACANVLGIATTPELENNVGAGEDAGNGDSSVSDSSTGNCSADLTSDPLNCGSCGHTCSGSACASAKCTPTRIVSVSAPGGFALAGEKIYYADAENIFRADRNGANPVLFAVASRNRHPQLIANDAYVAWTETDTSRIARGVEGCPASGCVAAPERLKPFDFQTGARDLTWFSLPNARRSLVWRSDWPFSGTGGADQALGYSHVDGGATNLALLVGTPERTCLTIVGTDQAIYVAGLPSGGVSRYDATGNGSSVVGGLLSCALAIAGEDVYYTDRVEVLTTKHSSGTPAPLGTPLMQGQSGISALAVDERSVYAISYTDAGAPLVRKCSRSGCGLSGEWLVGEATDAAAAAESDDVNVYLDEQWLYYPSADHTEIWRIAK